MTTIDTRRLRYEAERSDYVAGDDRAYLVYQGTRWLGYVVREWLPSAEVGGEPVRGWAFSTLDRSHSGQARTRAAAVAAAFAEPEPADELPAGYDVGEAIDEVEAAADEKVVEAAAVADDQAAADAGLVAGVLARLDAAADAAERSAVAFDEERERLAAFEDTTTRPFLRRAVARRDEKVVEAAARRAEAAAIRRLLAR